MGLLDRPRRHSQDHGPNRSGAGQAPRRCYRRPGLSIPGAGRGHRCNLGCGSGRHLPIMPGEGYALTMGQSSPEQSPGPSHNEGAGTGHVTAQDPIPKLGFVSVRWGSWGFLAAVISASGLYLCAMVSRALGPAKQGRVARRDLPRVWHHAGVILLRLPEARVKNCTFQLAWPIGKRRL